MGHAVVAVTESRVYMASIVRSLYVAVLGKGLHAASTQDVPTRLNDVLDAGIEALGRIEESIHWAEEVGLEPGNAWYPRDDLARFTADAVARSPVRFVAPVSIENKISCLGDVFPSHNAATGWNPDHVGIFYKLPQNVIGPWESIVFPRPHTGTMVGGTELALVIGTAGRYVSPERAWDHIWGYTVLNDVTLRGLNPQINHKSFDTSAPIGPFLVPKRQVANPTSLGLRMWINGRQVQDGNTRDMRFDMADSVSKISFMQTLHPGDIIATGDIGSADGLTGGDVVECEVEGVGRLLNSVVVG
jgi:2-keto-4-pentenoate hydratase/2-oxohepta-3-ene-1,7-dioic acid hydratase in catechol pathway